tara:strand:- start:151 stop:687 length:537 start_codon:yes stop_codon:yes gene_type:complete
MAQKAKITINTNFKEYFQDPTLDQYDVHIVYLGGYSSFRYVTSFQNCKHCHIDSIGPCLGGGDGTETSDLIDHIMQGFGKLTFGVNVTNTKYLKVLEKRFTLISVSKIPTGYHTEFQYHAIFLGNNTQYSSYGAYKARIERQLKSEENPNVVTDEVVDKIMAFKSKTWLRKYIEKLVN